LQRQWKVLPWLFFGTFFYSVAGSFHYRNLLWLLHEMPYQGQAAALYGKGPLVHFIEASKFIFGLPLAAMVVLGGAAWVGKWRKGAPGSPRDMWLALLVGYMPFLVYFAAHSIAWWKGWGNSLGLIRVMAAVIPPAALLGALAWDQAAGILRLPAKYMGIITGILCLLLTLIPFTIYTLPVPLEGEQKLVREASEWLKESGYAKEKIHYFDPFFPHYLDKDPFDREGMHLFVYDTAHPEKNIQAGELVLWDAHFGPNEGGLPLSLLRDHSGFRLVRKFTPAHPFMTLGGQEYGIYIFQRVEER
jgi:hypothetical protein